MTVVSRFTGSQPLSLRRPMTCLRRPELSASFQRESEGGKCEPISPRETAPSRASMMAWIRTSPSEWASHPRAEGISYNFV